MQQYIINVDKGNRINDCLKVKIVKNRLGASIVVTDRYGFDRMVFKDWDSFVSYVGGKMIILKQTVAKNLKDLANRCTLLIGLAL